MLWCVVSTGERSERKEVRDVLLEKKKKKDKRKGVSVAFYTTVMR